MRSLLAPTAPRRTWRPLLVAALLAFIAVGVVPSAAQAAGTDELSWSVAPGGKKDRTNFSYELEPGSRHKDSFVVTNLGSTEITLAIYAADGITSSTGALDLKPAAEASEAIGAWVTVEQPLVTLGAGERSEIDFVLDLPKELEPGDYVGGLISSYADTSTGSTVLVDRRLATRMNVNVAGDGTLSLAVEDLNVTTTPAWNPFAPVEATLSYTLRNTGTLRARGTQTLSASGPGGIASTDTTIPAAELIPGGTTLHEERIQGIWPLFQLKATVDVLPEGIDALPGTAVSAQATTWALPLGQLGLLVVVIGAAVILGVRSGRSRDIHPEPSAADSLDVG